MYKNIFFNNNSCKKRLNISRYGFQRCIIVFAVILWLITVARVLSKDIVKEVSVSNKKDMVSIFCDSVYRSVSSELTAYGVLTESYLSDDAKKILLEDMAGEMGLNTYRLTKGESEYALVQNSVYGDVVIKITYKDDKYYLVINMELDKGIESTIQYRRIIEDVCSRYGVNCNVNVCLQGAVDGDIGIEERKALSEQLLEGLKAKEVQSRKTMDMFVVYAWDNSEKDYIMLGNKKVNVNISMEYDEDNDKTWIYLATPIYVEK